MNIIDERNKRNNARRRMKEVYDSRMTLSVEDKWYKLLQEGMITYSDGSPYFYIMKGAIQRFYESIDPSYEGSINIGHTDLASFPERIVGKWTKADLRVVDIEDGRQALETTLPVNEDHPLIKALSMSEFDLGLSVEMRLHINEDLSRNADVNPFNVPMVEDVEIYDFAIVGNAGDVNSMGVTLKGDLPKMDERLKKLAALLDEDTTSLSDVTKLLDENLAEAEKVEEKAEEKVEEKAEEKAEEPAEEAEEDLEAKEDESAAEEETSLEEAEKAPEVCEFEQILEQVAALQADIEALKAQLAEKDAVIAKKDEKLAQKDAEEKAFVEKFKNLSVSLTKEVKREEAPKSQYTDGIGE